MWVVAFWICQAHTGGECRKDNRGRPKRLMSVDREFIAEGKALRVRDRQVQDGATLVLQMGC
jgi:hypothetical protein